MNIKQFLTIVFCNALLLMNYTLTAYPQNMIISVPVADLRFEPIATDIDLKLPTSDLTNPLQITQLLLAEHVIAQEEYIDDAGVAWIKVNALQQPRFLVPMGWHGYQGWMLKKNAIVVDSFPTHNLVVRTQRATIINDQAATICTVSIGTRLHGVIHAHDKWHIIMPNGTTAWINDRDVYYITPTLDEPVNDIRQNIINTAKTFMGSLYSWGGRSAQNPEIAISSVDCSALLNLSFLAHGLQIPRMSREQFLQTTEIDHGSQLQPGDFVFFASITKHPFQIDHVMMFIGDGMLLETTIAGESKARIISFKQRLGVSHDTMQSGDIIEEIDDQYNVYFGTFFTTQSALQILRDQALQNIYQMDQKEPQINKSLSLPHIFNIFCSHNA